MNPLLDFLQKRKRYSNEYFACPGSRKTVMIGSFIWWTEVMAFALLRLGYNVLVVEPWYLLWLSDAKFAQFDKLFVQWVQTIRKFKVQLAISGNAAAVVPHIKTRELLHRAAGIPLVNIWWDDPRQTPTMARRGISVYDYLNALRDPRTLNVIWDADVCEELGRFLRFDNVAHVPLATAPELWPASSAPLEQRATPLCFLGNNPPPEPALGQAPADVLDWADRVAGVRQAHPDKPMADCVQAIGGPGEVRGNLARRPYELAPSLKEEFERWQALKGLLDQRRRAPIVRAAAERLGERFTLVGKGWDRAGLVAGKEFSGIPDAGDYYASAQASLNLVGGSSHSGLPLRTYEIAASGGLLFSFNNRELASLFEPGKECVAFDEVDSMREALDRILASPQSYHSIVAAGRARALAEHTWEARLKTVLELAKRRFDLPW